MGIIKKISFTILALTVSAQIGIIGTPQAQIGHNTSIQTIQNLLYTSSLAYAANAHESVFYTYNGQGVAYVTYNHNGTVEQKRINGATGTYVKIDEGTLFTITYKGQNKKYNSPTGSMAYTIQEDGSMTKD